MDIITATFESVAVLLGIGVLGFSIIVRRILPEDALGILSTLALDIALPCLIFTNLIINFRPEDIPGWWMLPLWWLFFTALAAIMTGLFMFTARKGNRREFAGTLFYQNAIFFPLAIITGIFGGESRHIVTLFLFTMFNASFFFSTNHMFFHVAGKKSGWKKILNSVLIVTIMATVIPLIKIQIYIPGFVILALKMVGGMAVPIVMIILGGNIYIDFKNKGQLFISEVIKFILIKNIIFPVITLLVLLLIQPAYNIALIIILQSAVPPITAMPIVVDRAGGNKSIVNQFMFFSFIFSLVTIPVMLFLFKYYFTP